MLAVGSNGDGEVEAGRELVERFRDRGFVIRKMDTCGASVDFEQSYFGKVFGDIVAHLF